MSWGDGGEMKIDKVLERSVTACTLSMCHGTTQVSDVTSPRHIDTSTSTDLEAGGAGGRVDARTQHFSHRGQTAHTRKTAAYGTPWGVRLVIFVKTAPNPCVCARRVFRQTGTSKRFLPPVLEKTPMLD